MNIAATPALPPATVEADPATAAEGWPILMYTPCNIEAPILLACSRKIRCYIAATDHIDHTDGACNSSDQKRLASSNEVDEEA